MKTGVPMAAVCFEQPLAFCGSQLIGVTQRLSRGTAMAARQITGLRRFPNHEKRGDGEIDCRRFEHNPSFFLSFVPAPSVPAEVSQSPQLALPVFSQGREYSAN